MARTKASVGAKVSSGKSSKAVKAVRSAPAPSSASTSSSSVASRNQSGGGNPVCHRETPKWQRPITKFFITKEPNGGGDGSDAEDIGNEDEVAAGSSKSKPRRNIIESDEETDEPTTEPPMNRELDETIELEPLSGESSHKMDEYITKKEEKGKGIGKKTKDKENIDSNTRSSIKRDLETVTFGEEIQHASKRVKVDC